MLLSLNLEPPHSTDPFPPVSPLYSYWKWSEPPPPEAPPSCLLVTGERIPYNPATDPATTTTTPGPVEFILNTITPLPWYMRLMGAVSLGALIMGIVMARPQKKRPRPQGDA